MSGTAARAFRRVGSGLLWYGLPALALTSVVAYILAAITLHVNPPVVPIQGVSMRPTLQSGELVFLEGVEPSRIHKGEIIAVNVPKEAREKYNLPSRVVHRVVKIEQTATGPVFQTKGDGNAGADVFKVHGDEVVGRMTGHVTGLGYPLLFFRSTQGKILAGAIAIIALLYFLMGLFEERQTTTRGTALGLQAVLEQTEEIRQVINGPSAERTSPAADRVSTMPTPTVVRRDENAQMLDKLVVAVGEYGEHLRSHTAVMQGLAQATSDLRQATEELRRATAGSAGPEHPPAPELEDGRPFLAGAGQDPSAGTFSPPAGGIPLPETPSHPPVEMLASSAGEDGGSDATARRPAPAEEAFAASDTARSWMRQPIEPRTLLLLAVTTATAVYLRRRLARTR